MLMAGLLTTSCGRTPGEHVFEFRQEDGYTLALTSGAPLYDSPPFRLTELVRVHQNPEVVASLLKDPGTFRPGLNGTLIVAERTEGRILVYDDGGDLSRSPRSFAGHCAAVDRAGGHGQGATGQVASRRGLWQCAPIR